MKRLRIETSVREAQKAYNALIDAGMFNELQVEASNVFVTREVEDYDEEERAQGFGDEYLIEQLEDFKSELEDTFNRYGVNEYEITIF